MNYLAIRKRVVERMAEYQRGAAEASTASTISKQTIFDRIIEVYRDLVAEIAEVDPAKVTVTEPLAYAANSESVALPAVCQRRPVVGVERLITASPVQYDTLKKMTARQRERFQRDGETSPDDDGWQSYGYHLENVSIYVLPIPTEVLTLRIRYVAAIADITAGLADGDDDDTETPELLPEEDHAYLALETALRFLRETSNPVTLEVEAASKRAAFERRAAASPKSGPRSVHTS